MRGCNRSLRDAYGVKYVDRPEPLVQNNLRRTADRNRMAAIHSKQQFLVRSRGRRLVAKIRLPCSRRLATWSRNERFMASPGALWTGAIQPRHYPKSKDWTEIIPSGTNSIPPGQGRINCSKLRGEAMMAWHGFAQHESHTCQSWRTGFQGSSARLIGCINRIVLLD